MLAHQYLIRLHKKAAAASADVPEYAGDIAGADVRPISYQQAKSVIADYEWLGNMAQRTTHCFGIFFGYHLGGVACFATPNTMQAAIGVAGAEHADQVKVLSRGACVWWAHPHAASKLISRSLRWMTANTPFRIFLAYADPRAGEIGTVYQASNWLYTGQTNGDIEYLINDKWRSGRSARHKSYVRKGIDYRTLPSRRAPGKYRYIWIGGSFSERKAILAALKYPVLSYPKRGIGVNGTREGSTFESGVRSPDSASIIALDDPFEKGVLCD